MRMWTKYKDRQSYNDQIEFKKVSIRVMKEYRKAKKIEKKLVKDIKNKLKAYCCN